MADTTEPVVEIPCNLCGHTCALGRVGTSSRENYGLLNAAVVGGYESTPGNGDGALDDMVRHRFSMCEFCLDWLFAQFVIPVAVDDPMRDHPALLPGETIEEGVARLGNVPVIRLSDTHHEEPPWRPAAQRVKEDEWRKQKEKYYLEASKRAIARLHRKREIENGR